jgi:hypothetical protein
MNDLEFAEKAQEFLPEEILNEMGTLLHTVSITAPCETHMLMSYVLDYGVNVLASQIGVDEVKQKVWPTLQKMAQDVNEAHVQSVSELRDKYPEAFAQAEAKATKSTNDVEHKLALLKEMLGQVEG